MLESWNQVLKYCLRTKMILLEKINNWKKARVKEEGLWIIIVTLMWSVQMVRIFFLRYKKRKRKNLASKAEYFGKGYFSVLNPKCAEILKYI